MRTSFVLAICVLFAACTPPARPPVPGGAIAPNRTQVVARVMGTTALGEHRFRLRLAVEKAQAAEGFEPATQAGATLDNVYPNFVREEGQPTDYQSDTNAHLLRAGGLAEGTRIIAVIEHQGTSWLLHDWSASP